MFENLRTQGERRLAKNIFLSAKSDFKSLNSDIEKLIDLSVFDLEAEGLEPERINALFRRLGSLETWVNTMRSFLSDLERAL